MKRLWMTLAGIFFGFGILLTSLFRQTHVSNPQVLDRFAAGIEYSTQSAQPLAYRLPYPGILPDSPLYVFKMVRDRMRLVVTQRPVQRVDLYISYGDKRVGAAYYLAQGNKIPLAYSTALKGLSYMDHALTTLERESFSAEQNQRLSKKLHLSLMAHSKTLQEVVLMLEGDARVQFEGILDAYEALLIRTSGRLPVDS